MSDTNKKALIMFALGAYGIYWLCIASQSSHWIYWSWAIIPLVTAWGVAKTQAWAAMSVYCITAVTLLGCLYAVWGLYSLGWADTDTALVAPAISLSLITLTCSWLAYTLFKNPNQQQTAQ